MGESVIVLLFEYFSWIDFLHGEISERLSASSWYSNDWGRKAATNIFRFTFSCLIYSLVIMNTAGPQGCHECLLFHIFVSNLFYWS